jgi:hypothetical protein
MKLTYTIPNLTIKDAAHLEDFLNGASFDFEARPANETTAPVHEEPRPPIHRTHLTPELVTKIYTMVAIDRSTGQEKAWKDYAPLFGVSAQTVARIASGQHPMVTDEVQTTARRAIEAARQARCEETPPPAPEETAAGMAALLSGELV